MADTVEKPATPQAGAGFHDPPWDAPLDVAAEIARIPPNATQKGLLMMPMVDEARRRGVTLKSARPRYLPFGDYPLAEHSRLLVEAAHAFYPQLTTRRGLRKLGRAAVVAFARSMVGNVMWSTVTDVASGLVLAAKAYDVTGASAHVTIVEVLPRAARVRLEGVLCFFDSNHVGVFEGILRAAHAERVRVAVRVESPGAAGELLLTWTGRRVASTPPSAR